MNDSELERPCVVDNEPDEPEESDIPTMVIDEKGWWFSHPDKMEQRERIEIGTVCFPVYSFWSKGPRQHIGNEICPF